MSKFGLANSGHRTGRPASGRPALLAVLLVLAMVLAGCTGIPTSGPVEEVNPSAVDGGAPAVDIEPAEPVPGGDPDAILAGFLTAVLSSNPNRYTVARDYLTPQAAENWDPSSGVTVYSSDGTASIVTDKSAVLKVPVIGRIDTDGHYTAVADSAFSHNFDMERDSDGQWRINNPGTGIFVSQDGFQRSYRAVPVYFFNRALDRLVVENLYMNWGDATPTSAVAGLLRGPSAWLSPAALTVIPPQTKLAVLSVAVQDGVAQVSLTGPASGLTDTQQVQLAAQLWWTLQGFTGITGLRIDVEGQPMSVPGQDAAGVVRASTVGDYRPIMTTPSPNAFGIVKGGGIVQLDAAPGVDPQPVPGPLGVGNWGDVPLRLAVGADGTSLAMTSATALWVGSTTNGQAPQKRLEAPSLTQPQIDDAGVWVISGGPVPILHLVKGDATIVSVKLSELAGAHIIAFRVAPDQTRIAVLAHIGQADVLGLLRITSTSPLKAGGWRQLFVETGRGPLASCLDVGWLSPSRLVVVASAAKDASVAAYRLDVDAAVVENIGPVGGDTPAAVSVQPRVEGSSTYVVTAGGTVLRYEDRTRWTPLASGILAVAQAG